MPAYTRRLLRQTLGKIYLQDIETGLTTSSWGTVGSLYIVDSAKADLVLSGEGMYSRAWIRVLSLTGTQQDARVAYFRVDTGGYQALVTPAFAYSVNTPFEIHTLTPPSQKDIVIDDVLQTLRTRKEMGLPATVNQWVFSLGPDIVAVENVRILGWPVQSHNYSAVNHWRLVTTATGREIRVSPALGASSQLAIDAITVMTWTPGATPDVDTLTLTDNAWILSGAAARIYWLLEAKAPAQEVSKYSGRRKEMATLFTRMSQSYQPQPTTKQQLGDWNG